MDEIVVGGVARGMVPRAWPKVKHMVEMALEHSSGEVTLEQLLQQILANQAQLWVVARGEQLLAAAVTEIVTYRNMTSIRIVTLGGTKMADWQEALCKELEQFAIAVGAARLEAVGREGFTRQLAPLGFSKAYTVLVREVKHEQNSRNDEVYQYDRTPRVPTTIH